MTVIEMIHSFWLKAKTLDQTEVESVKSFDVVTLLNNSVDVVIDELVQNKRWDLLRPITTSFVFTGSSTPAFDSSYYHGIETNTDHTRNCVLPSIGTLTPYYTYRNYIRSQSNIDHSDAPTITGANVSNEDIPIEFIREVETSGTNVPMFTNPKTIQEGGNLIVIGDGYTTINNVTVVFVRTPAILDPVNTVAWSNGVRGQVTTCELPTDLHQRIIDVAVNMYYAQVNTKQSK